ncbi:MAG: hypothetical protein EOP61_34260 [Sphingomonadales bacterium]|nr:MAG: hypothetical protein EOP61_34260 [Sphingomonadales bacterium]
MHFLHHRPILLKVWGAFWALFLLLIPIFIGTYALVSFAMPIAFAGVLSAFLWGSLLAWLEREERRDTDVGQIYARVSDFLGFNDLG